MNRIRLTKNELKKQRDSMKLYSRYLPALQLKKQQIQLVLSRISRQLEERRVRFDELMRATEEWVALFGEQVEFEQLIGAGEVKIDRTVVAGVSIPVFREIVFSNIQYDLYVSPLWVDTAVVTVKKLKEMKEEIAILRRQMELLKDELRTTAQRVNLFEKVKIPETEENIRLITIYLGDQQTAAVVRGKIAKRKMQETAQ